MQNKKIYTGLIIVLFIFLTGCTKNDNGIEVKPVKDPRTYTWTADTLGYPGASQTLMTDIWGSSPNDVYVVGHNSSSGAGVMWHYDGDKWTNIKLLTREGGQISGFIDLSSIYGFSSTDIYAVGSRFRSNPTPPPNFIDSSLIIHYDGSAWRQVDIYDGRQINRIYGNSSSDIWAGGWGKKTYHYNGSKWEVDSININVPQGYFFQITSISSYNGNYYTVCNINDNIGHSIFYLIKKNQDNWAVQDSFYVGNQSSFGEELNLSKTQSFYSSGGGGVYKYNGVRWNNIFYPSYITAMWGSNDNNIFTTTNSKVYHYNGTDWKEIEQLTLPGADYWAVWTDGTEAFLVGHIYDAPYQKTIIWHGK